MASPVGLSNRRCFGIYRGSAECWKGTGSGAISQTGDTELSVVWTLLTVCALGMLALFAAIRSQLLKR